METLKTTAVESNFQFTTKNEAKGEPKNRIVHPRIQAKKTKIVGSKSASNLLLLQMYSQENDILFI
ncbi:hypothetical protein FQU23_013910 [Flavobacterium sp. XN-5]|uniref:Uncharacterized protein n=1 Tax=Flavobacterium hiemivividum TaxID=2541734 RepID=A0A4R5CY84_9FLAO|nr:MULTISPECIES: hypothetical protein [Flavobacterium]NGY38599.1 hypothetical protein [Flavobacterium sp. XN-5]TDE02915.1 hypothetical protein E0F98_12085 [Flavobacterium hiemivividum]